MRETVLGIALVAIATGVFRLLSPESGFKKQIAFLVSAFFLLSCVSLFTGGGAELSEITEAFRTKGGYVDFSVEAYRMTEKEIADALSKNLKKLLSDNKIFCDEIFVIIDISSSYSISIKQVRLAFSADNAGNTAKAEELVKKEVGDEIEVITEIKGY
ncbi:MAG: hypothetical protein HFE79_03750 [Ruminiclostridium sp.]|nr:hypothetical protein [Ruminiclostridium sp.]